MLDSLSARSRRLLSSLAYTALVAAVAGLGYLTFRVTSERRHPEATNAEAAAEPAPLPLVELDNFSARRERSSDSQRLNVSVRLRLTATGALNAYAFVLAHNDHVSPRVWAVWPPQGPNGAVSAGGHFRGTSPATGEPITLTASWTRLTATLDHPSGSPQFDTVMIYVVSPKGEILLSRPFAL